MRFEEITEVYKYVINYDYKVNEYVIAHKKEKEFKNLEELKKFVEDLENSRKLVKINFCYEERKRIYNK